MRRSSCCFACRWRLLSSQSSSCWENAPPEKAAVIRSIHRIGVTSPFAAAFSVPIHVEDSEQQNANRYFPDNWGMFGAHMFAAIGIDVILSASMIYLLHARYRVSQSGDGSNVRGSKKTDPADDLPTAALVE